MLSPARKRLLALVLGTLSALLAAEVAVRLKNGRLFDWKDYRDTGARHLGPNAPNRYDAALGWVPRPGRRKWDRTVETIDAEGLRVNGGRAVDGRPILAVGDSFTFGDEVDDDQTWPAWLERITGRRVLNGGVSAYGLDQAVLRAEVLIDRYRPDLVILAACPDDIDRCERRYYCQWKPYFALDGDDLALCNVPVPCGRNGDGSWAPKPPPDTGLVAHSALANSIFSRFCSRWWFFGHVTVHDQGEEVAARLLQRLSARARAASAEMLFVVFEQRQSRTRERIVPQIDRARKAGIEVIDLGPEIAERARIPQDPGKVYLPGGHYAAETNRWIAERLIARLRLRGGSAKAKRSPRGPVAYHRRRRPLAQRVRSPRSSGA